MSPSAWFRRLAARLPQSKQIANEATKKKALKDIMRAKILSVRAFYDSYGPIYYNRCYSLYNFLTIKEVGEAGILLQMDDSKLNGHRVSPSYIYEYVVKKGYHGGAISGPPDASGASHPSPGTPYWRTPDESVDSQEAYRYWGRPATSGESIFDLFNKRIDELQPQWGEYWANKFQKHWLAGVSKSVVVTIDF